ncbi:MAG TPA: hypothetical protein VH592_14070 [Gemmataceae bacterium]|jgi:hypothetical protein
MNDRDLTERLEVALQALPDTEPIRELVAELATQLRQAQAELATLAAGVDAQLEGGLTALQFKLLARQLRERRMLYQKAVGTGRIDLALAVLDSEAGLLGLATSAYLEAAGEDEPDADE